MRKDQRRQSRGASDFSSTRGATLAEDLDILMGDLCRLYGFCNHLMGSDLVGKQALDGGTFAIAVLNAEGFPEPELELTWLRTFEKIFAERYGSSITASEYLPT